MLKILHRFFYAWIFLTKLPAPPLPKASNEDWGRIIPYFVLIGFILSIIVASLALVLGTLNFPVLFSALLILFLWILITGGFHLDGLMDTFDGIGCKDEERKFDAVKDSRVGAIGVIAGISVIMFKLCTLTTIFINNLIFVIIFSIPLARLVAVYSLCFLDKNDHLGKSSSLITSGTKKPFDFIINFLVFILIFGIFMFFTTSDYKVPFLIFVVVSFLISLMWSFYLNNHFKGHSGDTYGALIELSEVSSLSIAVILKGLMLL